MAATTALTLANICSDVQISICMCLHPSDILALRKTCKALQCCTRRRVVWEAALYRICIDNALFLPSFSTSDMDDLELEMAATGPCRWIEFCRNLEKGDLNDPGAVLHPRTTKYFLDHSIGNDPRTCRLFLVPGGRYLVIYSPRSSHGNGSISVFDLHCRSSANCKLIASVELEAIYEGWTTFTVQATPNSMGLSIFLCNVYSIVTIYEIYPQDESPRLTKIAHLEFDLPSALQAYILPGTFTVVWSIFYRDRILFRVWDYRLNHSMNFLVDVESISFDSDNYPEVIATKTAIIVLCEERVLIWAIPLLLPQSSNFINNDLISWNLHPTTIPPLFTIPFPENIDLRLFGWRTMSPWYFGSTNNIYFDMLCQDSTEHTFQIIFESDLSSVAINSVNTLKLERGNTDVDYTLCEDSIFACQVYDDFLGWTGYSDSGESAGTRFLAVSHGGPAAKIILPDLGRMYGGFLSCPASGTFLIEQLNSDENDCLIKLDLY